MSKVIRVSESSYKQIACLMSEQGVGLQEAADCLIQQSPSGGAGIPPACVGLLQEHFSGSLASPENLREVLDYVAQAVRFYAGARKMFTCRVCGKFIRWSPDDELGEALRDYVARSEWIHDECDR